MFTERDIPHLQIVIGVCVVAVAGYARDAQFLPRLMSEIV